MGLAFPGNLLWDSPKKQKQNSCCNVPGLPHSPMDAHILSHSTLSPCPRDFVSAAAQGALKLPFTVPCQLPEQCSRSTVTDNNYPQLFFWLLLQQFIGSRLKAHSATLSLPPLQACPLQAGLEVIRHGISFRSQRDASRKCKG